MISHVAQTIEASFVKRGLAYLIDCVCAFAIFAITQFLVFLPARTVLGISDSWFRSGVNTEIYTLITISIPVSLYFAFFESSHWRATIGKRLLGIQVIDATTNFGIPFKQALFRTLIKLAPWELAHIGNNLPEPIWFAEQPSFRIAFAFSGFLMVGYVVVILLSNRNRGIHDSIAGTMVINQPDPQR